MDRGSRVNVEPAVLAVGVDIIEVERLKRGIARYGQRFYNRFFTAREQEQCAGRAASLAGRFAVKEAVSKALGTGIGDVAWKEIEVLNDGTGRPGLTLHGAAARLATERGLRLWAISLSHTDTYAVGMATALGSLPGEDYGNGDSESSETLNISAGSKGSKRCEE